MPKPAPGPVAAATSAEPLSKVMAVPSIQHSDRLSSHDSLPSYDDSSATDTEFDIESAVTTPSATPAAKLESEAQPTPDNKSGEAITTESGVSDDDDASVSFDIPADEKPAPAVATPAKQGEAVTIPEGPRNYSEYPPELVPILKALNNTQFALHAPKLRELHERAAKVGELEAKLAEKPRNPEYWHENPDGYLATQEYRDVQNQLGMLGMEHDHWRQQLLAIQAGQPWVEILGYDQSGKPVYKENPALPDGKIDYAAQLRATEMIQQAMIANTTLQQRAAAIKNGYLNENQRSMTELSDAENRIFPDWKDEAKLSAADKRNLALVKQALPKQFSGHPLTRILGKAYGSFHRLANKHLETVKELERVRGLLADRKLVDAAPKAVAQPTKSAKESLEEVIVTEDSEI